METGNQSNERRERLRIAGASARDKAAMTFRGRTRAPDRGKGQQAVTHALPPRQTQWAVPLARAACVVTKQHSCAPVVTAHAHALRSRRTHCY